MEISKLGVGQSLLSFLFFLFCKGQVENNFFFKILLE